MDLARVLGQLSAALHEAGIPHALIGGLALAAHGAPRATLDLDLLADGDRDDAVDRIMRSSGYECLHRSAHVANYAAHDPALGRVDFLFARREYGRAMLKRARPAPGPIAELRVVDAADLIGLKVQASSNDPGRKRQDLADIERLLRTATDIDRDRVREYFRLFDREKELDALLVEIERK